MRHPEASAAPLGPDLRDRRAAGPAAGQRTVVGRWKMLLILAVCAAPVVASYLAYYVVRPQARSNYGELIVPPRPLPADLALTDISGRRIEPASLHGQWLLVTLGDAACDRLCESNLVLTRQLREALGREKDRVDRIWLLADAATPAAALLSASGATALHAPRAAIAAWLAPAAGHALDEHVYLVDPMGRWMLRAPVDPDPAKFKRDLERLLRASASWDRAGR